MFSPWWKTNITDSEKEASNNQDCTSELVHSGSNTFVEGIR